MLNIIDLFSGAGGLTEGFRDQDINIVSHVEMDKAACMTLKTREAFYYLSKENKKDNYVDYLNGDISWDELLSLIPKNILDKVIHSEISEKTLSDIFNQIDKNLGTSSVHGIIGGPPCQAYSTIGRARNEKIKNKDKRIYLYKHYISFLERYTPDFFIFENVKGLLSFKDVDGSLLLPKILEELNNVSSTNSYHTQFQVVNSADYGVPQKRERLFIFGCKSNLWDFDFFESLLAYREQSPSINSLFRDLPRLRSGETKNDYSATKPVRFVSKYIRTKHTPLSQNICRKNNSNDLEIYKIVAKEKRQNRNVRYCDLPQKLITHKKSNIFLDRFKAIDGEGCSHTVVAHISKDGHYYIHPDVDQNRSITVREAARIQTFPDNYFFENSRTAAFRQIGNAVPPYLARKLRMTITKNLYE